MNSKTRRNDRNTRRDVLRAGAALSAGLLTLGTAGSVLANSYPSRPVRMIVAFPPGGATDILGRAIGQRLAASLGQQLIVENKPGAGGMLGLEAAAAAAADGYTLFLCALTNQAIAQHLYPKASTRIASHFDPVALVANGPHMLNVHPSVPARNMGEFVAWLKANNGKINYASHGNGTLSHLETEVLAHRLGVQLVHVPYKGSSNAMPDLLAGNVSFMFDSIAASLPQLKAGRLRALAVAASRRVPAVPDLPTISEAGVPGYDVDNWFGFFVPKGTPRAAVERLDMALAKALKDDELNGLLSQQGYIVSYAGPDQLAELTRKDIDKWGRVVQAANVNI